jgi:Phage tail assembly chaperone protein, TAC
MLLWAEMMRSALATGIGPEDFWRLSLTEWRWLAARGAGLKAGRLQELMAAFPDKEESQ